MPKDSKKKTEAVEVTVVPHTEVASVESFITKGIESNVSVETMERLFALRKEVKAEMAKEAFTQAMSKFQAECPIIEKKKIVYEKNSDKVRYKFAPLDSIVLQVKEALGRNGLSYSFDEEKTDKSVKAICMITHILGHSKTSSFEIPIGEEQYMSDPQKHGARITFAKRYAFLNALGILTGDEDTDAQETKKAPKPKSVKPQIMASLRALGVKEITREGVAAEVQRLTNIELSDDEIILEEIAARLALLVDERESAV